MKTVKFITVLCMVTYFLIFKSSAALAQNSEQQTIQETASPGNVETILAAPSPSPLPTQTITPSTSTEPQQEKEESNGNYNLDGLVVEGRKSKVDALLDLKELTIDIDEVMFIKSNFDDYFAIEKNSRPFFAK